MLQCKRLFVFFAAILVFWTPGAMAFYIVDLDPDTGAPEGGEEVILSVYDDKEDLKVDQITIRFDGILATNVTVISYVPYGTSYLSCTTPAHATGVVDVELWAADVYGNGDTNTVENAYAYQDGPLTVTTDPQNAAIFEGENHVFTVAASGGVLPYTYQWQKSLTDWQNITGETGATLTITSATTLDNGTYRCHIEDAFRGSVDSAAATLTVNQEASEDVAWVDFDWTGTENGAEETPYNTVEEALTAVSANGIVRIKGDSNTTATAETPRIDQAVRLESIDGTVTIGQGSGGAAPDEDGGAIAAFASAQEPWALPQTVYEKVLPHRTQTPEGQYLTPFDGPVAVRLRAPNALDPSSLYGVMENDCTGTLTREWQAARENSLNDLWIVVSPDETWCWDESLRLEAGGVTVQGEAVESSPATFRIESEAACAARRAENATPLWQPTPGADFDAAILDLSQETSEGVAVYPAAVETPLDGGVGAPCVIEPERVYAMPRRVWLPVPSGVDAHTVTLWYGFAQAEGLTWYPADRVEGFLQPESDLLLTVGGTTYCGFVVRHAGLVQLALPAS